MTGSATRNVCRQRYENDQLTALVYHISRDDNDRPCFLDLDTNGRARFAQKTSPRRTAWLMMSCRQLFQHQQILPISPALLHPLATSSVTSFKTEGKGCARLYHTRQMQQRILKGQLRVHVLA